MYLQTSFQEFQPKLQAWQYKTLQIWCAMDTKSHIRKALLSEQMTLLHCTELPLTSNNIFFM